MAFLEEIIDHVLKTYPDQTGEICIVTPNRRAGLFMRKYLSQKAGKSMWVPDMYSIEDFINRITGYSICDKLQLMLEFYEVYSKLEKDDATDADSFFAWAPAVLRDFDDIDNALADRDKIYDHLVSARYIDTWNPDGSEPTAFQKNYLAFLEKLRSYHNQLAEHLTAKQMAWQGLSSRMAAERICDDRTDLPWKRIIFTGFNALTQAEESLIHHLIKTGKAEYHIDADPFYTDDTGHEAGRFIRKYRRKFNLASEPSPESHFANGSKQIHVYGIARPANQARLAGNLLQQDDKLAADASTAVVLADEGLLIPMLNALPEDAGGINVTMGYPLSMTNMYAFFDSLFKLHLHALPQSGDKKLPSYHHKDLQRFFSQSTTALHWDMNKGKQKCIDLLNGIKKANLSFCTWQDLLSLSGDEEGFEKAFAFLGENWNKDGSRIFPSCLDLCGRFDRLFREKAGRQGQDILKTPFFADFESLYHLARMFRQMDAMMKQFPFLTNSKTIYRLIRQGVAEMRLPFTGEPLEGLQVMGMLETRSLDFKHVMILSMNEGILPKPRPSHSLIPYEVKKSFGLRLYHEQDAIYAYHFYRLLQRAETVTLIYNTQTQDLGSNEKSRYITQLQHELSGYNTDVTITENIVFLPPPVNKAEATIQIEKSPEIMDRLMGRAEKGFSPSALARYIRCPLQFYFEKIAGLEEAEEVEETLEARTLGTVIHGVLEDLYGPLAGKIIQSEHLESIRKRLGKATEERFREAYSGGMMHAGKNLLLFHLTMRYLEHVIRADQKELRAAAAKNEHITLEAMEKRILAAMPGDMNGNAGQKVHIKGVADRIDKKGGLLRIIDYKTGAVQAAELKIATWDEPLTEPSKEKSFQLLCYAWLYHQQHPDEQRLQPGIISTRAPGKGLHTIKHPDCTEGIIGASHLAEFTTSLQALIKEILDPYRPFTQTEDPELCKYCAFLVTCRRQ